MATSRYKDNFRKTANELGAGNPNGLPKVSTQIDSIRIYNFEVQFNGTNGTNAGEFLTLAAKRVQSAGASVEDIQVRRLNDLMHYPGAANHDALIITFDNLLLQPTSYRLYEWFSKGSYDMRNGQVSNANISKMHSIDVLHLDNSKNVNFIQSYYGVYVEKFAPGEHNYSTANDFHNYDVTFRYDFMELALDPSYGPNTQATTSQA